ncbi:MAG: transglutaminase-like cysteine peptidase [Alphaproteobacteria bacterium]|nr:transglutaminase-like cysteine peptidase [Alphaproteobacteria bacterium]
MGALIILCATLLGCIREDSLYPLLSSLPIYNPETMRLPPIVRKDIVSVRSRVPDDPPEEREPLFSKPKPKTLPPVEAVAAPPDPEETEEAKEDEPVQEEKQEQAEKPEKDPVPVIDKKILLVTGRHTYFINREVRSNNIKMFPRWTGMLARYGAENHKLDSVCGPDRDTPCKLKEWKDFLEDLKDEPLMDKITEVNRYLNKYPYVDDIVNWGIVNYWETPYEFQRKSGNCKDYAIAKFMSLRAIGVPGDLMRIVVLRDLNLGGIIHAVLVVSVGEKNYILDNQIKQVISTDKVYHYVPIYSINEEHWWQHFMLE